MVADPKVVDPDAVDEDPEEHMGEVTLDPWADSTQLDWPNQEDESDDEPADESDEESFVDERDNVEVID